MEEIGDYMTSPVLRIGLEDTAQEAAVFMQANNVGSLIVENLGEDVGIVTERDLSQKVVGAGKPADRIKIGEIMTSPILTMDRFLPIEEANRFMMKHKIRHLGVTEVDKIIGILSVKDLVSYYSKDFRMQE